MTPAKKAAAKPKSFDELVNGETSEEETSSEDSSNVEEENVRYVEPDKDHVPAWQENPEHNLAKVNKDVIKPEPVTEHAGVMRTVIDTVYAQENPNDDTGLAIGMDKRFEEKDESDED